MTAEVTSLDIETIERLSEAAIRSGHTQTAVEGFALALRLRAALGIWAVADESVT